MALKVKKVPVTYIIIDLSNKPKWYFTVNSAGTAPTLQFGDKALGDSYEIVQYLDTTYPTPSLKPKGNEEAEKVTGNIFNLFGTWAKHSKEATAAEAEANFTAELQKIEDFLAKGSGPLLCGASWSVADCSLVPRLYHITTIADKFLNYSKYNEMPNLMKYMKYAFESDEFKATDYPREWILKGWAKYFSE